MEAIFEEHRKYLFGIAYRMLGSAADADDMVQETFIRWRAADHATITAPRAFLSTVLTRICLDRLKESHARRVDYVGPWLPEPVPTDTVVTAEEAVEVTESISLAFLVLLESLTPLERAVHLLHDVFDYSHDEVGAIIGRDPATCRKILERARKDIIARRPRYAPSRESHLEMLTRFAVAVTTGDPSALESMLAHDVASYADANGKATAARKVLSERTTVAKFFAGLSRLFPPDTTADVRDVNGWPALVVRTGDKVSSVLQIETDGKIIFAIRTTLNPDKLVRFD